ARAARGRALARRARAVLPGPWRELRARGARGRGREPGAGALAHRTEMKESTMSGRRRVIQWGTGNLGHEALRGILASPELALAGVLVYSAEKDGVDAGSLCGAPATGIRATRDRAAILRTPADCVVYAPRHASLDEVCEILATGKSVVATPFL